MINLQKLRHLSCICAYCNKVMPMEERTNDHIIPRSANGQTEVNNIVICCQDCNGLKGNSSINDFLKEHPKKAQCFYNYLNMIDYQMGNSEYSDAVSKILSESLKMSYLRKKRKAKKEHQKVKKQKNIPAQQYNDIQNIEYKLELSGKVFYINELQSKILDYYIKHPNFSDYKELAEELGIGKTRFMHEISCINNLTGIFKIKNKNENGIIVNNLLCDDLHNKIVRTTD